MTKRRPQRWSDLEPRQQRWIAIQGSIQTVLLAIAAVDLARRPAEQISGRKRGGRSACSCSRWGRSRTC